MPGRPVSSPNHLYETRHFYDRDGKPRDFYMCMSRQSEVEKRTSKSTGKQYDSAVRNHQNALALKSLFIDLDIKNYTTAMDALKDFERFIREANLPWPNAIVYSGGGYHFYWAMSEAIPLMEWQPLANALSEAIKRHKLIGADTQCTVDAARVLRLPPTMNHKYDPPRKVEVKRLEPEDFSPKALAGRLTDYMVPTAVMPQVWNLPKTEQYGDVSNNLAAGIEAQPAYKVPVQDLFHECPLIVDTIRTHGNGHAEPLWSQLMLLCTFLEDGENVARIMSKGDPRYTPEGTETKYLEKETAKKNSGGRVGWPHCTAFHRAGSTLCETCPHFTEGKSPLNFARVNGKGALEAPLLPEGYFYKDDKFVWRRHTTVEGQDDSFPVYRHSIIDGQMETNSDGLCLTFAARGRQITVPTSIMGNLHKLQERVQQQGMMLNSERKEPQHLSGFLSMWSEELLKKKNAIDTVPSGWERKDGEIVGFVFDGKLYTKKGAVEASHLTGALRQNYRCVGSKEPWHDARELLNITREDHMVIVASAFASPLTIFTGQKGLIVSAYSHLTSAGKSTMVSFAQSVWGDPRQVQQLKDTETSMGVRMSQLGCMPGYWDEVRLEGDQVADRVFSLTGGKDKQRATRDIKLRDTGTWECMTVFLSNASILRNLARQGTTTDAGLVRVFEFEMSSFSKGTQLSSSEVSIAIERLSHNYGHIGAAYSEFLGRNYDHAKELVRLILKEYEDITGKVSGERYWIATMAALEAGTKLAYDLGFIGFEPSRLRDFLLKVHDKMRNEIPDRVELLSRTEDVFNIYAQFKIAARGDRHWIMTELASGDTLIEPPKASQQLNMLQDIWVHTVVGQKEERVSLAALKKWLLAQKYNPDEVIQGMISKLGASKGKTKLGSGGLRIPMPQEPVLYIPHSSLLLDETIPAPT